MALTEEQLLAHLEAETVAIDELIEEFDALAANGKEVRALEWAELLKDSLVDKKQLDGAVATYEWIALKQETSPAIAQKELLHILSTSRKEQKFIPPAFEKASSVEEAFLRLRHLRAMKKGMLCYNKTWGFGIVERVDAFYQKVEIEFEKKGDHEFAFSYAADALDVLTDDHLLAIRHNEPEKFAEMLKKEPGEVVRITLRSYGKLSVNQLEDLFVPDLFDDAGWKKFWAAARKDLKNDPLIEIPTKRTVPIRVRRKAKTYDEKWFGKLKTDSDVPALFKKFEEIQAQKINEFEDYMRDAIADRLAFIVKGGQLNQPAWIAQALVYAEQLGVEPSGVDCAAELTKLAEMNTLPALLEELPARFMQAFINRLFDGSGTARSFLLRRLPEFGTTALNETIEALVRNGAEKELSAQILDTVRRRACSPALLLWILRNKERAAAWDMSNTADLALQTIELIEQDHGGGALRAQNQLREQIESVSSLKTILAAMTDSQKRDFMRRISESPAWGKLDRQSLQAKIIKISPDLHEVVLKKTASAPVKEKNPRITSKHSYQARKDQFEDIVRKQIPENSKEIELARSYGDLRENAEFKYAKERQRLLGLQAEELQNALDTVKATDFAGFPFDVAGIATGVELEYADGTRETYYILGEWDQNEQMHIISNQAGMAKALNGAKAGDKIMVPTSSGVNTEVTVTAVTELPDHIKAWVKG
ncbi:MAG: GreA/GreB family elongation factor [Kiritimatiellales bacterium]|nr:GreA/GreB family elongation factor [Kiritimatiellota bacterium]MBL7011928.1 GreA/GreB family elongation factor [Kiritimatiellales bacterium]